MKCVTRLEPRTDFGFIVPIVGMVPTYHVPNLPVINLRTIAENKQIGTAQVVQPTVTYVTIM